MPAIVIDIFREGLSEVKEAVREVSANVNQLRGETVSRHDYERFLDRYHIEWAAGQQKHDKDIADLREEVAGNEARRVSRGRFVIASLLTLAGVLVALLALILTHWK